MVNAKTRLYGLMAHPAQHSLSPLMHNLAFAANQINAIYMAFDVLPENFETAIAAIKVLNVGGVNLSMPLKALALPLLDKVDSAATLIGAVNTIRNDNGQLSGFNTDGKGLINALPADFKIKGAHLVLIGAGGAAKAVAVQSALDGVAEITIFNRHYQAGSRAMQLQQLLTKETTVKTQVYSLADLTQLKKSLATADLLLNATNVGMGKLIDESPVPSADMFSKDILVYDMIYAPRETRLLKLARQAGMTHTANGLEMLLQQGAAAFKLWTGKDMPVQSVRIELEKS